MGTNYYIDNLTDPYEDGGKWHIGKKSAGWDFIWADPPHDRVAMRWLRYAATMDHLLTKGVGCITPTQGHATSGGR